jgi:hypothetical protein
MTAKIDAETISTGRKLSWNIIDVSKERIFLINYQVITKDRYIRKMHIYAYYAYNSVFVKFLHIFM